MNFPKSDGLLLDDEATIAELDLICDSLTPSTLGTEWRERLLRSASHVGRFERFAPTIAEMLDIEPNLAQRYLDWLGDSRRWVPGFLPLMSLIHLELELTIGPAIAGFVRLVAGTAFPEHEHLGQESILVIQGSCDDSGRIVRPGDRLVMPRGSSHSFIVRPGPDLVYLAVVQNGLRIGGREILADAVIGGK